MDPERRLFLTLIVLPAILSQQECAWYLGFRLHNIPRLVEAGLVFPLGHPEDNSVKHFALADLERLRADTKKLSRAMDAVQKGWKHKNRNKCSRRPITSGKSSAGRRQQPDQRQDNNDNGASDQHS